jgi:hypothetical protein
VTPAPRVSPSCYPSSSAPNRPPHRRIGHGHRRGVGLHVLHAPPSTLTSAARTGPARAVTERPYFARNGCGFADFPPGGTTKNVEALLYDDGVATPYDDIVATDNGNGTWRVPLKPGTTWRAGHTLMVVTADGKPAGETAYNVLQAAGPAASCTALPPSAAAR